MSKVSTADRKNRKQKRFLLNALSEKTLEDVEEEEEDTVDGGDWDMDTAEQENCSPVTPDSRLLFSTPAKRKSGF